MTNQGQPYFSQGRTQTVCIATNRNCSRRKNQRHYLEGIRAWHQLRHKCCVTSEGWSIQSNVKASVFRNRNRRHQLYALL